ncbi:MAG: hypothetical protein IJA03_03530, partial [Bacteroidaceae bacterium]|nr:hypothetical protein [Bacteroidaceae bacterium]
RRLKKSPWRVKKSAEKLDNRYTDVVSLQCKVHESQTLKYLSSRGASATKDLAYIHVYASEILPPYGRLNDN